MRCWRTFLRRRLEYPRPEESGGSFDRQSVREELQARREVFHTILASLSTDDLKCRSRTRWTNEQLLFHILFGYILVVVLIGMVKLVGRLPRSSTQPFATLLRAVTGPFNVVNYWGSRLAAVVYNSKRMGLKFDRVIASLITKLDGTSDATLERGMYFPSTWDPFFKEYMTLADLFHYPTQHFDFHLKQLSR